MAGQPLSPHPQHVWLTPPPPLQSPVIVPDTTSPITGWTLELSLTSGEGLQRLPLDDPHTTNTTLRGLQADTLYRARVAGENSRGTGLFSDTATARTKEGKTPAHWSEGSGLFPSHAAPTVPPSSEGGGVGIPLIAGTAILAVAVIAIPAILLCVFKYRLHHMKQTNHRDPALPPTPCEEPASLTPCAAYGVTTHEGTRESGPAGPEYETITPGKEPEYEKIPETLCSPGNIS